MNNQDLLSDEEISALLPETPPDGAVSEREKRQRVVPYNFRRPDRLSKEQIRSLYLLHDLFAQNLSSSLPLFLRTITEVSLISVEQHSFGDYLRAMPDPTLIFTISADALQSVFAVELSSAIAFPVIDRMLGGEGLSLDEKRAATELEMKILEGLLTIITDNYSEAWKPIIEFKAELTGHETRPQLLQIIAPNEVVAIINYQMQVGETLGGMSICLPITMLEKVIEKFDQSSYSPVQTNSPEALHSLLQTISAARFPISAELGKIPAAVSELMDLAVGDVLQSNHRVENPVNICLNNQTKFAGKIAALNGKIIVQITTITQKKAAQTAA